MKDTELVFWDWNGTLMDDVDYSCACLNGLLAAYHPVLAESYMDLYNAGVDGCPLTDGAADTLGALAARCEGQVLLSVSRRDYLVEQAKRRGVDRRFREMLGLDDIHGVSKVELGRRYMASCGADPARCVMIGDTDHDAETARAMGVRCILYTGGHQTRARLQATGNPTIDRLEDLPGLL